MPLAALAGLIGLVSAPPAEIIAAPAALAASATLAIVDRLGAPASYLLVGVPPADVVWVIAATSVLLLAAIGGDRRALDRGLSWLGQWRELAH